MRHDGGEPGSIIWRGCTQGTWDGVGDTTQFQPPASATVGTWRNGMEDMNASSCSAVDAVHVCGYYAVERTLDCRLRNIIDLQPPICLKSFFFIYLMNSSNPSLRVDWKFRSDVFRWFRQYSVQGTSFTRTSYDNIFFNSTTRRWRVRATMIAPHAPANIQLQHTGRRQLILLDTALCRSP